MENKEWFTDNLSEEKIDFICTNCDGNGKIVEAVRYCIECSGYCCQTCTDIHKTFPILKDHNLLDASQGNQASNQPSSLPEFPTERCILHAGKVIDMYCEEHNEVGCYICISTQHKSCPTNTIYLIPNMIGTLFNRGDCKQLQSRLREFWISMKTLGKSKNENLEALKAVKNGEIQKVLQFQRALESIIRKAAEASRNQIESKCKELEDEIIQEKQDVKEKGDMLERFEDKLIKAEGNRAQRFVCSKIAQKKMNDAESQISKQKSRIQLSFTPNQSLMNYINGLKGLGVTTKRRLDPYKIKYMKDFNIKVADDKSECCSFGCCITQDNHLLVTDFYNRKLKRIDLKTNAVVDYCKLDSAPYGVCCSCKHEAVVTCGYSNKLQFVSITEKLIPTRQVQTSHCCYGIAIKDNKAYVTNNGPELYIYDISGRLLTTISQDNAGNALFSLSGHVTFNEASNKLYVSDWSTGIVCIDEVGNYMFNSIDSDMSKIDGVCVDGTGNMFIIGCYSHNVVQYTENGMRVGEVIKKKDGLNDPRSVCFQKKTNKLFVTNTKIGSSALKMFELH